MTLPPLRRWRDYLCLAVVAAGLWASFPDVGWSWAVVPSLAVLVATVDRVGAGRASWYCVLVGMAFWLAHIEWARVATGGAMPWVVLSATQAVALGLWGWTVSVTRVWAWARTVWGQTVSYAVTWVGVEELRSRWPFGGFPWAKIAYTQVDSPLGHLAPLGGEVLVSGLAVAVAVLVRRTFSLSPAHTSDRWWGRPATLAVAVALFVVPLAVPLPTAQQAGSVRVGVVQGNVEIPGNETFSIPDKVTGNHVRVSDQLVASGRPVDVVFWGENSTDLDPLTHPRTLDMVQGAVDRLGVPTLVGRVAYDSTSRRNFVGFWYPGTGPDSTEYGKQHPVPFGEYIPWRPLVAALATEAAQVDVDMVAVDNPGFLTARLDDGRDLPVAVGICFEVAYEPLVAQGVRLGGRMIVIPTNNYHFRYSAESTQQAQMLRFRAMEFSRSAVQASTNGVSAVIRPDGSVVAATDKQVAAYLVATVPLRTSMTPAARLAEFPSWVVMAATVVLGLASAGASLALGRRGR